MPENSKYGWMRNFSICKSEFFTWRHEGNKFANRNDVAEGAEGSVDVGALSESISRRTGTVGSLRSGQVDQIHDGALLRFSRLLLGDLVKDDGDYGVCATARRVHVC